MTIATSQPQALKTLNESERQVRDARDTEAWSRAAKDADYLREMHEIDAAFAAADRETWPE